ncbi:hypothetical protein ES288_A08G184800v1 [Gossypium darwinii]|uniref:MHD domain-containing protein n=1 Tax=Gossypium darwinii TaxID=34276 RepID=A0A5D2FN95_GOSDA|nr:hypothetical protein ES288_A08G184800v1 [Gossypium darwinii]
MMLKFPDIRFRAYYGKTIKLDNVTFHQYVNLTRFKSEKTVSFVPPDGYFELMKFVILPTIKELGQTLMQVKSVFGVKMFALVVIRIPVPKQTVKQVSKSHQVEQTIMLPIDSLPWKIRKFPGQTKPTLSAEVELISTMADKRFWMRPPIQMEFEVWEKRGLAILPRAGLAHMRSGAK